MKLSCIEFTEPLDVPVVVAAHSPEAAGPNRTSLPSMFPPAWSDVTSWVGAEVVDVRVAVALEAHGGERHAGPDDEHDGEHRSALALVPHHVAEREREGERDHRDGPGLDEVVERRRVLERVGGVDVEEPAAVGAELLDGDLAGRWAAGDELLLAASTVWQG